MPPRGQRPRTAEQHARQLQCLELRLAGASYRTIGAQLGISYETVRKDVDLMLKETAQESADIIRQTELARLDRMMLAHWNAALKGDVQATNMVLQVMVRRARLLGLDAPPGTLNIFVGAGASEVSVDVSRDERVAVVRALYGKRTDREAPAFGTIIEGEAVEVEMENEGT